MAGSGSGEMCRDSATTTRVSAAICAFSGHCGHLFERLEALKVLHMCRSPPSYAEEPALFALDCEMCATATDDKALLSLCLVDVNGEIVLQVRC